MKHYNIPVFVPHNGCPNDCSFCNQKKITGKQAVPSADAIKEQIEAYLKTFSSPSRVEVAFFGGSFTGIEEELQRELLGAVGDFISAGKVSGIRISTRPDYINPYILDYLKSYGVTAIELGVQSMDDEVLIKNNRGHSSSQVEEAAQLIKSYDGFELGLQQMLGLYGSTMQKDVESAKKIAELLPDTVRIYPTIVLPGTTLYSMMQEGKFVPYTLEEAVQTGSLVYKIYIQNNIKVIRMGLQSTEIINEGGELFGPYHSSYGELVKARVIRNEIEEIAKGDSISIVTNPAYVSQIVGNKRENLHYFKEVLGLNVKITQSEKEKRFKVSCEK